MNTVPVGRPRVGYSIALCLISAALYALMSALIKWVSSEGEISAVIASRYAFSCLALLPLYYASGRPSVRTAKPGTHLIRGVLSFSIFVLYTLALERIPLQNAIVLNSSYVLFLPFLSLLLVNVPISITVALGLLFGFAGIVVISGTSTDGFLDPGSLLALGSALATAIATVLVTRLGKTENSFSIVFYFFTISFALSLVWVFFAGARISTEGWWVMALIGILGVAYQYFFTAALRFISSELASSVMNTSIIFGFVFSYVFFLNIPKLSDVFGAALILAGISIVTWHARRV